MRETGPGAEIGAVDLVSRRLGGEVVAASDDFFAPKENLIAPEPPVFDPDRYTERGKWMDGWESRRRRGPGHDWCVLRLGATGRIEELIVDTAHFRGNHPEACSVDAWLGEGTGPPESGDWTEILPRRSLEGDSVHRFPVDSPKPWSHLRLRIYPDGGVARLRVLGRVLPDWDRVLSVPGPVDLAAVLHGGRILDCSDRTFSAPENLIMPGASRGMHDGWETRRRRGAGHDWCVIALGHRGTVRSVEVDTSYFKGNYPDRFSLDLADLEGTDILPADEDWWRAVGETPLHPDRIHRVESPELGRMATHARLNVYPDGGVARLRLLGEVVR